MPQIHSEISSVSTFESILDKTGWGAYAKFMIAVFCLCSVSHAAGFLSISFGIPLSMCDLFWSENIALHIHTSFTIGRAFGGLFMNCCCDVFGRKRTMSFALLMVFLSTFVAAFAHSYITLLIIALTLGSGLESTTSSMKIHLAEVVPMHKRGFYLVLTDVFWSIGYVLIALCSICLKESTVVEHRAIDMRLTTWRMIFAISGGLNLFIACTLALLEESPRYLLQCKKNHLTLLILKQFYTINKSSYGENFQIQEDQLDNLIQDYNLNYPENVDCLDQSSNFVMRFIKVLKLLMGKKFLHSIFLLILLKASSAVFGLLEINLLLAKFLEAADGSFKDFKGVDMFYFDMPEDFTNCTVKGGTLRSNTLHRNFLLLSCNIVFGQIMLLLIIDRLGRKVSMFVGMLMAGFCYTIIAYVTNSIVLFTISSILLISSSIISSCVAIINVESFPTAFRGTSIGVTNIFGLLLTCAIIRNLSLSFEVFFVTMGALFLCTSVVLLCFMSDYKNRPMVE